MVKRLVGSDYREPIEAALALLPPQLSALRRTDFFCGADPVRAGMVEAHIYHFNNGTVVPINELAFETEVEGRPTIFLPTAPEWKKHYAGSEVSVVLHEIGHVVHNHIDWIDLDVVPLSDYAWTNHHEAFAESFAEWLMWGRDGLLQWDPATLRFLEDLSID